MKLLKLDDGRKLKSREYQGYVKKVKSIVYAWKRKYAYSNNDERFLSATLTQILEDMLEESAIHFINQYEAYDQGTNDFLRRRLLDPETDAKEQERLTRMLQGIFNRHKEQDGSDA